MLAPDSRKSLPTAAAACAIALVGCGDAGVPVPAGPVIDTGHPPLQQPPAHAVGGFGIELPPMTLAPGEEKLPCMIFPLDMEGPSRVVGGGSLEVGKGMHHGNITTRKKTGEGVRECPPDDNPLTGGEGGDILQGGAVLFASSTQISGKEWQSFPDGVGYRLRDGYEIVARMHYLNVSPEPLTIAPVYRWYTIDEAALKREIGPFAWVFKGFTIPPNATVTVTGSCDFPSPMHLVNLMPHMHRMGTELTGTYLGGALDGKRFLDSPGYDPERGVIEQYDPGVDLSQGDGASFSCTWHNVLGKTLVEGIGDNEMCILFGYAWPPENAYSATASADACLYVAPPPPPTK